jgi:glycogen debranching enzyme
MFSGWGVRTLSADHPAYNPLSYHLGSVWPVENATLLFGLKRFGFDDEVHTLARALYDLALLWRGYRIPECVGGYGREEYGHPGAFPQASSPQTWNQSVFPLVIQSLLGIAPVAPLNLLTVYPALPEWLPELTLWRLRVGDATVSLRFRREDNGTTRFAILQKSGTLHVLEQPPVDSLTARASDRVRSLFHRSLRK